MSFKVQPASWEDGESMLDCAEVAFAKNALQLATYPPHLVDQENPNGHRQLYLFRLKVAMQTGSIFLKIVDEKDGCIAGFAGWTPPSKEYKTGERADGSTEINVPKFARKEVFEAQVTRFNEAKERIWGKDNTKFWHLNSLAVSPDYQGKGIGKQLVQWGIEQSEKDGLPIYLTSTPEGKSLYERLGFETVEEVDFSEFCPPDTSYTVWCMTRYPKREV